MASSLNASTSGGGGVIVTSDATGNLDIQSGGSTVVAVTATGATVTGTLAATGAVTLTGSLNTPNTFGFKNRIINGGMVIDQRNAGASVTVTLSKVYGVDRFFGQGSITSKFTAQQSSTTPTGFNNSLLLTSSAATTPSASDFYYIAQDIEGYNMSDLGFGTAAAATVTLSFYVRSSLTGTFSGALLNSASNRSYAFTYTINSANTFEQKTVTIVGDTSGTWLTTNGIGIVVRFALGAGSSYLQSANSWGTGNIVGATGTTQWISTSGATFYITGVQLEKGSTATSFDFRDYGRELMMCQRYAYVQTGTTGDRVGFGYCGTAALFNLVVPLPVTMRAAPTLTSCSQLTANDNQAAYNSSAITIGDQITNTCVYLKVTSSGMTIGRGAQAYWTGAAPNAMILTAEL